VALLEFQVQLWAQAEELDQEPLGPQGLVLPLALKRQQEVLQGPQEGLQGQTVAQQPQRTLDRSKGLWELLAGHQSKTLQCQRLGPSCVATQRLVLLH
jgi:hypothetical protein